jgi:hypothetical protein
MIEAVQTFIVRIAPAEHSDDGWHGVVRRVADGDERAFHGVDQMLALMRPTGGRGPQVAAREREHD